jgi:hypothetical protein
MGESVTDLRLWFDSEPDAERSEVVLLHKGARIPVVALHSMGEKDLMGFVQEQTPPWQVSSNLAGRYRRGCNNYSRAN